MGSLSSNELGPAALSAPRKSLVSVPFGSFVPALHNQQSILRALEKKQGGSQEATQSAQRAPEEHPGDAKNEPKCVPIAPKAAPKEHPETTPRAPQEHPKSTQEATKKASEAPRSSKVI